MMVKATRISTASGAGGVGGHVLHGTTNEMIECVQGCEEDLDDMVRDAERHGSKYAIRHVVISPKEATTREQALDLVRAYAAEFRGNADRAVVVEHVKQREGAAGFERHWHAMIPEVDGGWVMDSSWMRARQEKLSRVAEIRLGHGLVAGRWNGAVERALRAEGRDDLADQVAPLARGTRPEASYTSEQHQAAKRAGLSMPHTKATAKAAASAIWDQADGGQAFVAAMAAEGLRLKSGDKTGVFLVEGRGVDGDWHELGAVHRLIKQDRQDVATRLRGVDFEAAFVAARQPAPSPAADGAPREPKAESLASAPAPEAQAGPAEGKVVPVVPPSPAETVPAPRSTARQEPGPAAQQASRHAPAQGGGAPVPLGEEVHDSAHPAPDPKDIIAFGKWLQRQKDIADRKEAAALKALQAGQDEKPKTPTKEMKDALTGVFGARQAPYDGRGRPHPGRDTVAGAGADGAEHVRQEGAEPHHLRGLEIGSGHRQAARAAPAPGAAGKGRADPNREVGEPGRGDGRQPGTRRGEHRAPGADVAADRLRARRTAKGIAAAVEQRGDRLAALTARLHSTPNRLAAERRRTAVTRAMQVSEQRISQVLATAPWPDPSSRDAREVGWEMRQQIRERLATQEAAAVAARRSAEQARRQVGLLGRIGFPTAARRAADRLTEVAVDLERRLEVAREQYSHDVREAEGRAPVVARSRQVQQDHWEQRPEVQRMREEQVGNQLVQAAIKGGDKEIDALASKDLGAARQEMLRRRAEEDRRIAEEMACQRARNQARRARVHQPIAASAPAGPRR